MWIQRSHFEYWTFPSLLTLSKENKLDRRSWGGAGLSEVSVLLGSTQFTIAVCLQNFQSRIWICLLKSLADYLFIFSKVEKQMNRRLILRNGRRGRVSQVSAQCLSVCLPLAHVMVADSSGICVGYSSWQFVNLICSELLGGRGGATTTILWSGCALMAQWDCVVFGEGCSRTGHSLQVLQQNDGFVILLLQLQKSKTHKHTWTFAFVSKCAAFAPNSVTGKAKVCLYNY